MANTMQIKKPANAGPLGIALLDYVKSNNLGIAHFASIGNRIDISTNDLLQFWEDDDNTSVILLYLETFGNPRRFSRIARRLTRQKPIIAVKAGRSDVGGKAATSHTGALSGSDIAVDVLFRQAGVIRVNTIEEMFNVAKNLAHQPLPKGPRLAILTNAGGPGVLAADAAISSGLSVPPLKDVAFSIHPLTDIDPDYMFSQLKGLPLLTGWRGSSPKDIDSLRDVLLRFSALIEDFPEIASVEINPLMVFEQGKGTMAVDARILFKSITAVV